MLAAAGAVICTSSWVRDALLRAYPLRSDAVQVAEPGVKPGTVAEGTLGGTELLCVAAVGAATKVTTCCLPPSATLLTSAGTAGASAPSMATRGSWRAAGRQGQLGVLDGRVSSPAHDGQGGPGGGIRLGGCSRAPRPRGGVRHGGD